MTVLEKQGSLQQHTVCWDARDALYRAQERGRAYGEPASQRGAEDGGGRGRIGRIGQRDSESSGRGRYSNKNIIVNQEYHRND